MDSEMSARLVISKMEKVMEKGEIQNDSLVIDLKNYINDTTIKWLYHFNLIVGQRKIFSWTEEPGQQ